MSAMSDYLNKLRGERNTDREVPLPEPPEPGWGERAVGNAISGMYGMFSDAAKGIGAQINALDEAGRESSYSDAIRNGTSQSLLGDLGDWLVDTGNTGADITQQLAARYGTKREYANKGIIDRVTTPGYLTDPGGLWSDTWQGVGSSLPFLATTLAAPEITLPGKMYTAARSIPSVARALESAEAIPFLGRGASVLRGDSVGNALNQMATAGVYMSPADAFINASGIYDELKKQGYSDSEAAARIREATLEELPYDFLNSAIFGGVVSGGLGNVVAGNGSSLLRRGLAGASTMPLEMGSEYFQESMQQRMNKKYTGKPYGTWYNPTPDEAAAGASALFGSILPAGLGAAHTVIQSPDSTAGPDVPSLDQMQENIQRIQSMIDSAERQRSQEPASDTTPSPSIQIPQEAAYTIANEVSNPTVTDLTEAKLRLLDQDYYNKYGRHFYITSMSREGNPDDSWHNTGQAFDTADDFIESNAEARAWLIERGKAYGLYGLDEYEHPSEHATGGHIHFSDHGEELSGDFSSRQGAMTKEQFFAAVAGQESGGDYSAENGRTGAFGKYQIMPENWSSWAQEAGLSADAEQTPENQETVAQFKLGQYYDKYGAEGALVAWYSGEANAERWVNGESTDVYGRSWDAKNGNGDEPSIREYVQQALSRVDVKPGSTAGVAPSRSYQEPQKIDTYDDELNSMYEGFIREQLEASRNPEDISFFDDMFTEKGKFKDTEENIEKIRERVNGDLAEDFAAYVQRQRQRERQQNAIADVPSGAVQGNQEAPKIEAKTSNLDAIKSRLDSMREEAIGRGDFDLVTKINKAVRTNNVEAMRELAGPMEVTPVEATQAPNVIAQPTQNVSLQETTAPQNQTVSTTQNAEAQTTPNPRMSSQGQISPAETMEEPSIPQSVTPPAASREQVPTQAESIQSQNSAQVLRDEMERQIKSEQQRLDTTLSPEEKIDESGRKRSLRSMAINNLRKDKDFQALEKDYEAARKSEEEAQVAERGKVLKDIPDSAIIAAKETPAGQRIPINIFTQSEQTALRKAGITYQEDGNEWVHGGPLFQEGERRYKENKNPSTYPRERRMSNESAETTSTETPVPAQNQDQYAKPGQAEQEAQEVTTENNERPVDDGQAIPSQNAPRPAGEAIGEEGNQVSSQAENAPRNEAEGESTQEANPSGEDQSGESDWVNELATRPVENPENLSLSQVEYRLRKLRKARQQDIDDEVERMKQTPGGKGVTIGYTYDERGNINGRWAESNNPEWYRRAYKQYGRKPPKSAYPQIAEESLKDIQEFGERDIEIARLEKLRNQLKEQAKEQPTNGGGGKSAQNTAKAANKDGGQENERKDAKRNEKIGSFSVGKTGKKFTATLDESLGGEYAKDHAEAIDTLAESFGGKGKDGTYTFGTKRERDGFLECANAYIALQKSQGNLDASASAEAKRIREIVGNMKIVPVKEYSKLHTMLSNLGEAMGCPIVWVDASSQLDGVHCNGVTFLNRNAGMDLVKTFWHEQFHWIVANNNVLADELLSYFQGKNGLTKQQLEKYRNDHNRHDLTDENTVWEVLADEFVEVSKRDPMLRKMAGENPSLAQRFVAWIKRMMDRVAEMFHNPDGRFTTKQRDAFVEKFGKLAGILKDGKGEPLFKTYQNGRRITLANGNSLLSKLLDMVENPLYDITGIKLSAAWHGSPHQIDRLSVKYIGTGEGAQVHGWGLYFAKERKVSEGYREVLRQNQNKILVDGKEWEEKTPDYNSPVWWAASSLKSARYSAEKAVRILRDTVGKKPKGIPEAELDAMSGAVDLLETKAVIAIENPGSLLQVEIPDEDVMLDEQKLFEEQPEKVQKALQRIVADLAGKGLDDYLSELEANHGKAIAKAAREYVMGTMDDIDISSFDPLAALMDSVNKPSEPSARQKLEALPDGEAIIKRLDRIDKGQYLRKIEKDALDDLLKLNFSGGTLYDYFKPWVGSPKSVSELLNEYGIKGITYEGGRDGRCYVVFDDDSIEITARFSLNLNSNTNDHSESQGASSMPEMQETSRKWLDGIANTFARKLHLKGDRIITEEREKGQYEDITLKQYLLNSPSRIADKVKSFRLFFNMGDRAMDKLTKLRSDYQRKYDKAMKTVKGKEDRESLFRLLWSGDLEGKEYGELTQEEKDAVKRDAENPNNTTKERREARIQKIMKEADVSHDVADAYLQVRQMMTKAYHMLNNARRQKKTTSERMTEGKLEKLRDNKFVEIVKVHEPEADGKRLVTYSEYGNHEQDYRNVTKAELDRMKQDKAIQILSAKPVSDHHGGQLSDAFGNPLFDVKTREGIPAVNKRKGYIPHFFHEYMIRVKDKDGNVVGDIIESARTEREAVKIAEEWKKTHELKEGENIYISPKSMNFEKLGMKEGDYGVLMGDKDFQRMQKSIADNNDMSLEDAKQMLDGSVRLKNRHRFFGNFLQRKGAKGFEQDMEWVLRHYFNSASRYAAMETEFKPKAISLFERLYGSFDKDYNNNALAQYTKEYINDINGTPSTMEKLLNDWFNKSSLYRKFMVPTFGDRAALGMANAITSRVSYMTLGMLNLSSALLNFTQLINIASYLGTGSGTKNLVRYMAKAAKGDFTLAERRILAETGVLNDIGLDSGSGYDKNRGYSGSSFGGLMGRAIKGIDQFGNLSMKLFQAPDMMCRVGAVLSAYNQAISQGKSRDDAIKYAKEINRKANFDYGVNDAPNLFRRGSIFSQLALQFKKYGFKEMEIVGEMAPALLGGSKTATTKQKAMFWGLYFLTCGLMGIPMLDWLDDLFGEKTGIYPKDKVQKFIMESFGDSPEGKAVASMAMYGILAGANVNISSRASLADVIPTRVSDLAGPSISKAHSAVADSFAWMFGNGNGAQVLRDFSPGLYNIYAAAQGEAIGNRDRLNTRYVTAMDRILRAVGFKSVDESVPADVQRIIYNEREQTKKEKQRAIDAYLKEPTAENKRRLDELHIKMDSVKKESERKKSDRAGRTESGLTKDEKAKFKRLLDFEK